MRKKKMLRCIHVIAVFSLFVMGGLWIQSAQAAEMLVSDPSTGCKVYIDSGERPGAGVKWKGACTTDGYANGDGTLYWTAGGKVYFVAHFAKSGGLIMENGHIRVDIPYDAITFSFENKCLAYATIIVKPEVYLAFPPVLNALVNRMVGEYKSSCAKNWETGGNLDLQIYYNKKKHHTEVDLHMSVDRNGSQKFYMIKALGARDEEIMRANQEIQEAAARNRDTQDRQRQERIQSNANQNVQAFAKKYGASGWVEWDRLNSNPFFYEGKILLFNTEFSRMITPTSGLFGNVVFSNLPKNAFTKPVKVLLAGKVLGSTDIKNQFGGTVSAPHIKYIGHYTCRSEDCEGYLTGRL